MTKKHFLNALPAALLAYLLVACGGTVPVAAPAAPGPIEIKNPSFDQGAAGSLDGWDAMEHNFGNSFSMVADVNGAYSAPASLRINRYGAETWGLMRQSVPLRPEWVGKTARLSAMLRSEGVDAFGAGIIVQTSTGSGDLLTWDHMPARRLMGNQAWARHSVQVKIPEGTNHLRIGAILEGSGSLWVDDVKLEIID